MNREKALVKNSVILGFGTFLPTFVSIITTPILTGKLTDAEYGIYDLINTLVMLMLPIATLQIQTAGFRFIISARKDKIRCKEIITNVFAVTIPAIIISGIFIGIFLRKQDALLIMLLIAYFSVDILNNSLVQIARGFSFNYIYSIAAIILSVSKMILVVVALVLNNYGLLGVVAALTISTFASGLFVGVRLKIWKYIDVSKISKKTISELLGYSWPMVPNSLSSWLLRLSDRLVITIILGVEQNAVYAVANKIPNLLTTVNSTFSMAWQENASIASTDKDAPEYYSKMYDTFFRLIAGSCSLLIGFTPLLFKLLIRGEYDKAYYQMPILFLGIFYSCLSSFLGGIYIANKRTKSVGVTTALAAACNLLINLGTVRFIGITAGSLSTLVSYILLTYYRMFDLKKFQPIKYNTLQIILANIVLCAMSVLCFFRMPMLDIINVVVALIFSITFNKVLIFNVFRIVRKKISRR